MRTIRVDFFRAAFPNQPRTFEAFLQTVNQQRAGARLRTLGPETALYMPNLRHRPAANLWTGELQHIRKTNLPDRIDLATLVDEALGLPPGQGLLERCHFAYRTDLQALALQANRYVRASTFEGYVGHVAGAPFELTLIIKRDAYQRLLRMRTIASLNVRIENPPDAAAFGGLRDPGVSSMVDLLTNFGAAKISVSLQRENRGFVTLTVDHIHHFVDRILNRPRVIESIRELSVKGKREDDDNLEAVDLIEDRLMFEGQVGYDRDRRLDRAECERLLVNALEQYENELRRNLP
jgi:hypothetical protein